MLSNQDSRLRIRWCSYMFYYYASIFFSFSQQKSAKSMLLYLYWNYLPFYFSLTSIYRNVWLYYDELSSIRQIWCCGLNGYTILLLNQTILLGLLLPAISDSLNLRDEPPLKSGEFLKNDDAFRFYWLFELSFRV